MNSPAPARPVTPTHARSRLANGVVVVALLAGGLGLGATATAAVAATPVTPAPATAETCTVDAATIEWGFKESFRSYVSGSIANGEWTVSDGASYETPSFAFAAGTGNYNPANSTGLVSFPGAITFTGHGGILNTAIANPQLKFIDAATAILVLDVTGTTQDGVPIDSTGVEFATIDLSEASALADSTLTITEAPTVLTGAGAQAFGTYEEGEEFDPLNASIPIADDCALAAPIDSAPSATPVTAGDGGFPWVWVLLLAFPAAALAFGIVLIARDPPWRR